MKTLKELRKGRAARTKHMVIIRLSAAEEENLVELLEKRKVGLTYLISELLDNELAKMKGPSPS